MRNFKKLEIYCVGKVGPKGQVVIPVEAREELGFKPGDKVMVIGVPDKKVAIVVSEETFDSHMGRMRRHFDRMSEFLKYKDSSRDDD